MQRKAFEPLSRFSYMGNWTNSKLFGCNLMSIKVFVEVVTALLFNASTVGLSVVLLFKLLESCHL